MNKSVDVLKEAELIADLHGFAGSAQKGKIPGESTGCSGSFKHKGGGGTCYISWGITYGSDNPADTDRNDRITWVITQQAIQVGEDADWKTYTFSINGTFPTIAPGTGALEGNFFDCYLVIEMPKGAVKVSKWFDDIYYRRDLVEAEFKDITATFS